jgi:hypothetical protein
LKNNITIFIKATKKKNKKKSRRQKPKKKKPNRTFSHYLGSQRVKYSNQHLHLTELQKYRNKIKPKPKRKQRGANKTFFFQSLWLSSTQKGFGT